jgi:hypothetical protein
MGYRTTSGSSLRIQRKELSVREMQLVYVSRPFGYDDLTLTGILGQARQNNSRNGITGALICREDIFMQMLEGRRDVVTSTFSRILRDDRHVDVVNLLSSDIESRLFPDWSMRHDPVRSWMWTREELANGAIGRASDRDIRAIFERLAKEPPGRL